MDIFNEHFQKDWKNEPKNFDIKLLDFDHMCRTCLCTVETSPILDMVYEDVSMINIIDMFLAIQVDRVDLLPKQLCISCTNQLIHFYTFRENCKISQDVLLTVKEKQIEEEAELMNIIAEANYSDNDNDDDHEDQDNDDDSSDRESPILRRRRPVKRTRSIKLSKTKSTKKRKTSKKSSVRKTRPKYIQKIKCFDCKMEFKTRELRRQHCKESGHNPVMRNFKCDVCGKLTSSTFKLQQHIRTHTKEKPFICEECPAAFSNAGNLRRHKMIHTGEKPFICAKCGAAYNQKTSLDWHMKKHDPENDENGVSLKAPTTRKVSTTEFTCDECGRVFKRLPPYKMHLKKHEMFRLQFSKSGQNQDEIKDKLPPTEDHSSLMNEMMDTNAKIESFITTELINDTNIVDSTSTDNDITGENIRGDRDSVDGGDPIKREQRKKPTTSYPCEICARTFRTPNQLKTHQLTHGEKTFLCTDCGRGFCTKGALISHTKVHTREKPYKCKICGKQFAHTGSLEVHVLTHTGYKPHRCDVCGKQFTQSSHLTYHLLVHSGEKPHVCKYCGRGFALKGNLTVHMRTHTGETPYVCDICGRGFYDSSSRKKHRKGHGDGSINRAGVEGSDDGGVGGSAEGGLPTVIMMDEM